MATTARADIVAGFGTMMAAFIAANPSLLRRHFRIRPESLNKDLPCSFLDVRPELVSYTAGVQRRVFSPALFVVDRLTENGETLDRADVIVDALVDFIGGYGGQFGGHITASTVWSSMRISDDVIEDGDTRLWAVRFEFPDLTIAEGR